MAHDIKSMLCALIGQSPGLTDNLKRLSQEVGSTIARGDQAGVGTWRAALVGLQAGLDERWRNDPTADPARQVVQSLTDALACADEYNKYKAEQPAPKPAAVSGVDRIVYLLGGHHIMSEASIQAALSPWYDEATVLDFLRLGVTTGAIREHTMRVGTIEVVFFTEPCAQFRFFTMTPDPQ